MISMSEEEIVKKVAKDKNIPETEVQNKINSKLEELGGLISKEGAAHIIANELGVDLLKTEGISKISNIVVGMRDVTLAGRVVRKYDIRTFNKQDGEGKVAKFLLGDNDGITMVVLWDDKTNDFEKLEEGSIVKITNLNVRDNNGRSEVHSSSQTSIELNPKGVEIKSFDSANTNTGPAQRKKISELNKMDSNVEIFVTIVQVFDPKFFQSKQDPNKRGAVLNLFVDDGSDNIRTVFWNEQIKDLIQKDYLVFEENIQEFENTKTELLGKMVKLTGRVVHNDMFSRLEFVVNKVDLNPDPDEEIKKIDSTTQTKEEKPKQSSNSDDELDEEVLSLEDLDLDD